MIRFSLEEYGSVDVPLTDRQAVAIQRAAGSALTVTPGLSGDLYSVRASSFVGTVVAGDVEMRVAPKVPIDNVLFLLVAGAPTDFLRHDETRYEGSDLTAAFAALFADALTAALRRGPQHEYREVTEDLDTIRGRIDLAAQFRRPGQLVPVTCRYADYTVDTEPNRYLKSAIRSLLRTPGLWAATRRQLRHSLASLDRVNDEPPPLDLPLRMRFNRLNRHYEGVLRLAHLVRTRVGLSHDVGSTGASSFLLDMNKVFERFVEHELRRSLEGLLEVDGQWPGYLDVERSVPIRPDLVFRDRSGRVVYVGDTKYKLTREGIGRSADYYQLHAYCRRFGLDGGVLIYATDDGDAPPGSITTRGDGVELLTLRLPLTGGKDEIRHRVGGLAAEVLERAHVEQPHEEPVVVSAR